MEGIASVLLFTLSVAAGPAVTGTEARSYSGTVVAVDGRAGVLVVEEVGPWRSRSGATELTRRTIRITQETAFEGTHRKTLATGEIAGFVSEPISRETLKLGDFVTVRTHARGERATAWKVILTSVSRG
jgi:hypothetical protein